MQSDTCFLLSGGVGFCNSVRRSLLSDVRTEAPCRVTISKNTTCQTDEFIAHRIGLIPFRRVGNGDTMRVSKTGVGMLVSGDLIGPAFHPIHSCIDILPLGEGHELNATIHFDEQPARVHSRYSPCGMVGMECVDADRCRIRFISNDHRTPASLMLEALSHLEERVDRALLSLANQPDRPPESFC